MPSKKEKVTKDQTLTTSIPDKDAENSIYKMYEDNIEAPMRKISEKLGLTGSAGMRIPKKK